MLVDKYTYNLLIQKYMYECVLFYITLKQIQMTWPYKNLCGNVLGYRIMSYI